MIVDFQHYLTPRELFKDDLGDRRVTLMSIPRGDLAELTPFAFIVVAARGGFCDAKASVCRKLVAG